MGKSSVEYCGKTCHLHLVISLQSVQFVKFSLFHCWWNCLATPLSKVDKLSQQSHRQQPPSNYWSWYQNIRPPGPLGPPPPTRPINGDSSPSQGPTSVMQLGRRFGSSANRSPTSSMLQNTAFSSAQVKFSYIVLWKANKDRNVF